MSDRRLLAIAHRAGNRIADLREAEARGVDVIEADVHRFFGHLEVRHEKTLGPLPILWERWYIVRPRPPRLLLQEVLASAAPGTELMLDLKGPAPRLGREAAALVGVLRPGSPLTVCARNWWQLRPFGRVPGVRRIWSVGSPLQLAVLLRLTRSRLDGVSIHDDLVDAPTARRLLRRTGLIIVWGARSVERMEELRALGVGGIITEDPVLLEALLADRELGEPS